MEFSFFFWENPTLMEIEADESSYSTRIGEIPYRWLLLILVRMGLYFSFQLFFLFLWIFFFNLSLSYPCPALLRCTDHFRRFSYLDWHLPRYSLAPLLSYSLSHMFSSLFFQYERDWKETECLCQPKKQRNYNRMRMRWKGFGVKKRLPVFLRVFGVLFAQFDEVSDFMKRTHSDLECGWDTHAS